MTKNFYEVLGIAKTSTAEEIKSAYKKNAIKYHPDRNQNNKVECEKRMKEINEAYETLGNPEKRSNYDRFGTADAGGGRSGFGGFGGFSSSGSGFEDIFEDINSMFNGGGRNRQQTKQSSGKLKGSDLRYKVKITLKEAYAGVKKNIIFRALGECTDCHSKGGEGIVTCNECNGAGAVRYQQGFFVVENTCPKCKGDGISIKNPCKSCRGSGRREKEFSISVDIPRGVGEGDNIKIAKSGEAGTRGGESGDLFVLINIIEDEFFIRDKDKLTCEVPITFTRAILGGEISIPLIDGSIYKLKIDEGIQNGDKIKVSNKGMPRYNSNYFGDLFISIKIETPVNLTKEQKQIVENLDMMLLKTANPKTDGFLKKIKKIFN